MTWYVALIQSAKHASIRKGLSEQRIDHYMPMERISKRTRLGWSDRDQPLLKGYCFVRTDRLDLATAIDGVIRIVGFPDAQPMSEPAVEGMYAIREAEAAGVFDRTRKDGSFKPGQRVIVVGGAFKGMIGEIIKYKGRRRVAVAMQALGMWRAGTATVDVNALEAA